MSATGIVKALLGDITIGDLLVAFANFTYDESTEVFNNFNGESTVPALYTLRPVKVWELVAGFDSTSAYDIIPTLKQIRIGDFLGKYSKMRAVSGTWTLNNFIVKDVKITGAANNLLSINIGDIRQ